MDIKYKLIRSNRKTVSISVSRDLEIVVKAPLRLPAREIDRIVEGHRAWILKKLSQKAIDSRRELTAEDERLLLSIAKRVIPPRLEYLASVTGLRPENIKVGKAKGRFGSCSSKRNITISCFVLLYPRAAQELVLVHELCHLVHMDHSKAFYSLLGTILPDHRERKKLLSAGASLTMDDIREIYAEYL